jgi:hypothetical protein
MKKADYLYYQVGNFKTTNKLTAIEQANGNLDQVKFYFNDDDQLRYDWTVEPEEDIDELVNQRVREIRDQYGYVSLWYSGGFDSQTILDSFVHQNIRLDEVVIYHRPWFNHEYNVEHIYAYNYANYVKKTYQPWLKINVIQYSYEAQFDFYRAYGTDWIYKESGAFTCFTKTSRYTTATFQKEFSALIKIPGRVDINGVDKPRVNLYNNKWYSQAADNLYVYYLDSPYEMFYISPAATKLYIKQTWLAIKWFEQLENISHELVHKIQSHDAGGLLHEAWNRGIGRHQVYDQIAKYGLFKLLMCTTERGEQSQIMTNKLLTQDPELYRIWKTGVDFIKQTQPQNYTSNGLRTISSQPIFVKDFTQRTPNGSCN